MGFSSYNSDPNANTSISGINIAEGCPPSGINNAIRQLMADAKDEDANVVVKLTGDQAVNGVKTFKNTILSEANAVIRKTDATGFLQLGFTTAVNGARLNLFGKDSSDALNGGFSLMTGDGVTTVSLAGKPDGTLKWGSKDVITNGGTQSIGGTKTFTAGIVAHTYPAMRMDTTSDAMQLWGGNAASSTAGAKFILNGGSAASDPGKFTLQAGSPDGFKQLIGKPDGTLTWDGKGFVFTSGDQDVSGVKEFSDSGSGIRVSHDATLKCAFLRGSTYVGMYDAVNGQWIVRVGSNKAYVHYGTLQAVSDKRLKTDIADASASLLDAWGGIRWRQFKYDGISDNLIHVGLVAQDVEDELKQSGITATDYGFLSHESVETEDGGTAGDQYYINYADALCIEAAYQRRRAENAEARIAALEQRLDELEAALATLGA